MKVEGWILIAAGVIFYLGVDRIVKAVEGVFQPAKVNDSEKDKEK